MVAHKGGVLVWSWLWNSVSLFSMNNLKVYSRFGTSGCSPKSVVRRKLGRGVDYVPPIMARQLAVESSNRVPALGLEWPCSITLSGPVEGGGKWQARRIQGVRVYVQQQQPRFDRRTL